MPGDPPARSVAAVFGGAFGRENQVNLPSRTAVKSLIPLLFSPNLPSTHPALSSIQPGFSPLQVSFD